MIATEVSPARVDMRFWWDAWTNFPAGQEGWFWGVEKQAAIGLLSQYEDYKGLVDEARFWSRAKTPGEISADWRASINGNENGLVGWFRFSESSGAQSCSAVSATDCINFVNTQTGFWSMEDAPIADLIFADGFESGDLTAWLDLDRE